MTELLDATGRTLLLTGAAGGIGSNILNAYHGAGGTIIAADLNIDAIPDDPRIVPVKCDVSSAADISHLVASAREASAHINDVVHCAGIVGSGTLADTAVEAWEKVMDVNLTSAFLLARSVFPMLAEARGNLILFSSTNGRNGGSALSGAAYACSKAAIIGLNRYLAKEWADSGIRVNCIAPGPVDTPMLDRLDQKTMDALGSALLTDKIPDADEIAAMACFLLSRHARSMTGTVINQSGGLVLD